MQKSKFFTIIILIIILLYFFFSQVYLASLGSLYTYIINPVFFMGLAIFLKIFLISPYKTNKLRKEIIQYVLITVLLNILLYLLSGLFTGFGANPYSSSISGLLLNLYSTGLVIVCKEYVRYQLIRNVLKSDRKLIFVLIVIIYSIQDIDFVSLYTSLNEYFLFKTIFYNVIPNLIKNILFTYLEIYTDYIPAILYEILMNLLLWLPPILPKSPWVLEAIIDSVFPLILLLYCRYHIYSKDRFHLNTVSRPIEPSGMIPLGIGIILVIWFALGIFPIKPVGVATGSMEPNIHVGDMVLIRKCNMNDVEEQDIIQYQLDDYTVIHRIVKKYQKDGETFLNTKGDNNSSEDADPVSEEQLLGKVIFRIPYIALPTIWLNNLSHNQTQVQVETGM